MQRRVFSTDQAGPLVEYPFGILASGAADDLQNDLVLTGGFQLVHSIPMPAPGVYAFETNAVVNQTVFVSGGPTLGCTGGAAATTSLTVHGATDASGVTANFSSSSGLGFRQAGHLVSGTGLRPTIARGVVITPTAGTFLFYYAGSASTITLLAGAWCKLNRIR